MAVAAGGRPTAPGVVELREDAPLKSSGGEGNAAGGVRALAACFAALSAGVTVALLAQVWAGAGGAVPHGAAAAGACSGAAAGVLRAGGRAVDAGAAAALCLAVAAPTEISLQSSGALLYWEYRTMHAEPPQLAEWGAARAAVAAAAGGAGGTTPGGASPGPPGAVPQLVAALAALHAQHGALPWSSVVQPALDLAVNGAAATASQPATPPHAALAATLAGLQRNTSAELWAQWSALVPLRQGAAPAWPVAGGWLLHAAGGGAARAAAALRPQPADLPPTTLIASVVQRLWALGPAAGAARGAAAALVDTRGTYVALVAGDAELEDATSAPLDLTAAMLVDGTVCGSRYVLASASSGGLAQVAARLAAGAAPAAAVEPARVAVRPGPRLVLEAGRAGPPPPPPGVLPAAAPAPLPAVAVLRQAADALAGHADSRAGGLAARF